MSPFQGGDTGSNPVGGTRLLTDSSTSCHQMFGFEEAPAHLVVRSSAGAQPPFDRSVSTHDGSQDRSVPRPASTGCGLGSWSLGGQPVRWTGGATRVVARASVFGARGCGCGPTGPRGAGTDHAN